MVRCRVRGAKYGRSPRRGCRVRRAGISPGLDPQRPSQGAVSDLQSQSAHRAGLRTPSWRSAEEADAHRNLGRAPCNRPAGRSHRARVTGARIFEELGDQANQGHAQFDIAWVLDQQGRHEESLHHIQRAHELYSAADDRAGQAISLNAMGWLHAQTGDDAAALECCTEALALQQAIADRFGEAATWDSLGYIRHRRGEYQAAHACYEQALAMNRELANSYVVSLVLDHIGDNHEAAGELESACDAWREAMEILRDTDSSHAEQVQKKLDSATGTSATAPAGTGRSRLVGEITKGSGAPARWPTPRDTPRTPHSLHGVDHVPLLGEVAGARVRRALPLHQRGLLLGADVLRLPAAGAEPAARRRVRRRRHVALQHDLVPVPAQRRVRHRHRRQQRLGVRVGRAGRRSRCPCRSPRSCRGTSPRPGRRCAGPPTGRAR